MIEIFKLIFFSLYLGVTLVKTLTEVALFNLPTAYKILALYTIFAVTTTILITTSVTAQSQTINYPAPSHPNQELYQSENLTYQELEQKRNELLSLLSLQPTHADVMVNLALTNQVLGNNEEFERLWQEAELIDPNNQIFSN